jgi:NAD(P)-dependent dehydrogenase (short-subunit alcohol dehydrogenase family)
VSAYKKFDLAGKRILLVGATGVLGRGYARAIAECGARLAIADRKESDVLAYAKSIKATGIEIDVADEASVVAGVKAAVGEFLMTEGDAFAAFEDYPLAVWQRTIDVNLTGTFLVAREAGRAMKQGGGGSLVTVSSVYGLVGPDHRIYEKQPFKSFPGYSASKAGIVGLTRWLATWWGRDGVRVNCLTPGGVHNDHDPAFAAAYSNRTPMGRMADREELVGMLLFLLSDASAYCTGQTYVVDGGFTAW